MRDTVTEDVAARGVTRYFGTVAAVDDVSFGAAKGEILALLGPSGCGKTTTLRMIAGLVAPSGGDIFIRGARMNDVPVHRRNVAMLFQSYALFPHLTVQDNVAFGLRTRIRAKARPEVDRAVDAALRLVRLEEFAGRYPAHLSGGQQQRVAVARALVTEPSVLLLDEPFSALDRRLREAMQLEVKTLVRRLGVTTILVTHDQEEAMSIADKVAVMHQGRIVQMGRPVELYERPATRFVADFIGTANFFRGELSFDGDGRGTVRTDDGITLAVPRAPEHAAPGPVTVAVRPEHLHVAARRPDARDETSAPNRIAGTVEDVSFKGSVVHYLVRDRRGRELVAVELSAIAGDGPLAPATRVDVTWDAESNIIVRED